MYVSLLFLEEDKKLSHTKNLTVKATYWEKITPSLQVQHHSFVCATQT